MSWPKLTLTVKKDIIGLLDYESRCSLRTCSKSDRDTVDSTKFLIGYFKIWEGPSDMSEGKTIIRIDIDTFSIWFIGKNDVTRVDRGWNREIIDGFSEIQQRNRYDMVREFLGKMDGKGFNKTETMEIDSLDFPPPVSWNMKPNHLKLYNMNTHYVAWLRRTLPPKLKKLDISSFENDPEITRLISRLEVSESFQIDHDTELTDEFLDNLEAQDLTFLSMNISVEAVKRRLEKFLKFGRRTDKLHLHVARPENFNAKEHLIPKGLKLKKYRVENQDNVDFSGQIVGGFENVHGVQDVRDIHITQIEHLIRIRCDVYEKEKMEFLMYPF